MATVSTKKKLFAVDYEIHASVKMLYPYIQTASGLSEWYAEDVRINNEDKTFTFFWDDEGHRARRLEVARLPVLRRGEHRVPRL